MGHYAPSSRLGGALSQPQPHLAEGEAGPESVLGSESPEVCSCSSFEAVPGLAWAESLSISPCEGRRGVVEAEGDAPTQHVLHRTASLSILQWTSSLLLSPRGWGVTCPADGEQGQGWRVATDKGVGSGAMAPAPRTSRESLALKSRGCEEGGGVTRRQEGEGTEGTGPGPCANSNPCAHTLVLLLSWDTSQKVLSVLPTHSPWMLTAKKEPLPGRLSPPARLWHGLGQCRTGLSTSFPFLGQVLRCLGYESCLSGGWVSQVVVGQSPCLPLRVLLGLAPGTPLRS